jgi:putative ABC transport system ATP-binding protein
VTGPAVRFAGVTKGYGVSAILEAVDLAIAPGEAVALLGRSGSGKTTLLSLAAGLLVADRGTIDIAGQRLDPSSADSRAAVRRQRVGYVFQAFNLIPTLNVIENLEYPGALARRPEPRTVLEAGLERVGLGGLANRFPDELSGGEQQRVAVLRALSHRPDVVLADEPTANLDVDSARAVMDLLLSETRERGAALLLVTHSSDLSVTLDRALRIQDRRLVAA